MRLLFILALLLIPYNLHAGKPGLDSIIIGDSTNTLVYFDFTECSGGVVRDKALADGVAHNGTFVSSIFWKTGGLDGECYVENEGGHILVDNDIDMFPYGNSPRTIHILTLFGRLNQFARLMRYGGTTNDTHVSVNISGGSNMNLQIGGTDVDGTQYNNHNGNNRWWLYTVVFEGGDGDVIRFYKDGYLIRTAVRDGINTTEVRDLGILGGADASPDSPVDEGKVGLFVLAGEAWNPGRIKQLAKAIFGQARNEGNITPRVNP